MNWWLSGNTLNCYGTYSFLNSLRPSDAYICVSKLNSIGSDNGLSPGRRQAIIWTNPAILLIWPLGTKFREMLIAIHTFSSKKIYLKMLSGKMAAILSRPQCVNPLYTEFLWSNTNIFFTLFHSSTLICSRLLLPSLPLRYFSKFCLGTMKPVYNNHLMGYFSAFWSSSRWLRST